MLAMVSWKFLTSAKQRDSIHIARRTGGSKKKKSALHPPRKVSTTPRVTVGRPKSSFGIEASVRFYKQRA